MFQYQQYHTLQQNVQKCFESESRPSFIHSSGVFEGLLHTRHQGIKDRTNRHGLPLHADVDCLQERCGIISTQTSVKYAK